MPEFGVVSIFFYEVAHFFLSYVSGYESRYLLIKNIDYFLPASKCINIFFIDYGVISPLDIIL